MNKDTKLILEIMHVDVLPPSIKDWVIPTPPKKYEGWLYKFTCNISKRIYIGIHKDDGTIYWHSSENEEFQNIFANKDSDLKYEILEYGDYQDLKKKEYKILSSAKARTNPEYFNLWNGFPVHDKVDFEKIKSLFNKIKSGQFITKDEISKTLLKDVRFLQVREKEYVAGAIKKIAEKLDGKGGDTSKSDPPVILADKFGEGIHFGIGGNHTKQAVLKSKHAKSIKWNLIPIGEHESFSETELNVLGNMLNAIPDNLKNDIEEADMIKSLLKMHNDGANLDDKEVKKYPLYCGFTPSERNRLIRQAKNEIEKVKAYKNNNLIFIDYSEGSPEYPNLEKTKKEWETNKVACIVASSAALTLDRIAESADKENKNTIVVVVYHSEPYYEINWKNKLKPKLEKSIKWFRSSETHIQFEEMRAWKSEIL
jgi:hypothetical protein